MLKHTFTIRGFLDKLSTVIPSSCALCGHSCRETLCADCRQQFFQKETHRCAQCAIPLQSMGNLICGDCLKKKPDFDATIVVTNYAPPIDQLVLALKFGRRLALAPLFSNLLYQALQRTQHPHPTQLAVVPLGPHRLAERGFNQALEIAKPLAGALNIPLRPHLIARFKDTQAQALLHPHERQHNVNNAFFIPHASAKHILGQHIGVVDDVITTGETLKEIARTLKRFGATRVTNIVFARTLHQ